MFLLAAATPSVPPPPLPAEERMVTSSPQGQQGSDPGAFPAGLSLVSGLGNPEWAHVGVAYRYMQIGTGFSLGSLGLANNLGATVRYFFSPEPGGPFAEAGATVVQLAETTPGTTPRDVFYQRHLGLGWQFIAFRHAVFNISAGLLDSPPRTALPPASVVSSSLLPHLLAEAGYAF